MRRVNRVLMGASKLAGKKKEVGESLSVMYSSVYTWENQKSYAGYSQLEPIIQMLYETKCKNTGDILEVILLCTKNTLQDTFLVKMKRTIKNESGNAFSEEVKSALAEANIVSEEVKSASAEANQASEKIYESTPKPYTAVDFLIHRIKYYMTGAASDLGEEVIGCNLLQDTKKKQYIYTFPEHCEKGEEKLRVVLISLDEENPADGLKTAFDYLKNNCKEEGAFWIDTHGGFREISMIMTSLVSLLRVQNIIPEKVLGVLFDEKKNCIVEQMQMIDINRFVAGMEEFINHGSTEILRQYYGDNLPKKSNLNRWLEAMNKISMGTQLCDPKLLKDGMKDLKSRYGEYERRSESAKEAGWVEDRYFEIFVDYIRKDYEDLLKDKVPSDFKIIKRCYEKKMYQQALTFIEACMPKYFAGQDDGLCYFESTEKLTDWREASNKDYESDEVFLFNRYLSYMTNSYKRADGSAIWNDKTVWDNLDDLSQVKATGPSDMKYSSCLNTLEEERDENLEKLEHVLILHNALKRCRNHYNHASEKNNRPKLEKVDRAIGLYISMVEDLEKAVLKNKTIMNN